MRVFKILNVPYETPGVGVGATYLIQLIVQKQVGLIFSEPSLEKEKFKLMAYNFISLICVKNFKEIFKLMA